MPDRERIRSILFGTSNAVGAPGARDAAARSHEAAGACAWPVGGFGRVVGACVLDGIVEVKASGTPRKPQNRTACPPPSVPVIRTRNTLSYAT